jgi:hypothetical protein
LETDEVRLVDYVKDPLELDVMESWSGIDGLINDGVEGKFGTGASEFLREAKERHEYMQVEIMRRYGLEGS